MKHYKFNFWYAMKIKKTFKQKSNFIVQYCQIHACNVSNIHAMYVISQFNSLIILTNYLCVYQGSKIFLFIYLYATCIVKMD